MVVTGIYYAMAFIAGGVIVGWLARPAWGAPMFLLAAFFLWFFRDPERTVPQGPHAVSPADGRVTAVKPESGLTRVSIFLNPFDVHVNRTPVGGRILEAVYKPGEFLVASREEASVRNEQNIVTVECDDGVRVVFKQIAGLVARRCVLNKTAGDIVQMGERIGLMQFSSRMDVLFGPEWRILVREGQRVVAGETIIAQRNPS
ncbi:MAG: phosphatidylserine decarboxylase [Bryobacteraceae bacterium]